MPLGAVKYEDLWMRAKDLADKNYPQVKKGSERYWSIVMGIYKMMEKRRDKR
jgi:hypothetical protein